jgi:alkylhydroperoxidase family enzyme
VIDALLEKNIADPAITSAERSLLELVERITYHAYRTSPADVQRVRDAGWTEPQIAEAVYVSALFAFFNRVADAFGIKSQGYGGPQLPTMTDEQIAPRDES